MTQKYMKLITLASLWPDETSKYWLHVNASIIITIIIITLGGFINIKQPRYLSKIASSLPAGCSSHLFIYLFTWGPIGSSRLVDSSWVLEEKRISLQVLDTAENLHWHRHNWTLVFYFLLIFHIFGLLCFFSHRLRFAVMADTSCKDNNNLF